MYEIGVVYRNIQRADAEVADKLGAFGSATVHEAMGRVGLMHALHAPDLPGRADVGHGGDRAPAAGRQLDAARRGRADPAGRHRGRGGDGRVHRRLLRRAARHVVQGARRARARHRRRLSRREGPGRDGVPGLEPRHQRQGDGQGHARLGQHPGGLRRRAGAPGRRDRRRRRRRRLRAARPRRGHPRRGRQARGERGREARPSSPPACWASTCTGCASRWRPRGCGTSTDERRDATASGAHCAER